MFYRLCCVLLAGSLAAGCGGKQEPNPAEEEVKETTETLEQRLERLRDEARSSLKDIEGTLNQAGETLRDEVSGAANDSSDKAGDAHNNAVSDLKSKLDKLSADVDGLVVNSEEELEAASKKLK